LIPVWVLHGLKQLLGVEQQVVFGAVAVDATSLQTDSRYALITISTIAQSGRFMCGNLPSLAHSYFASSRILVQI